MLTNFQELIKIPPKIESKYNLQLLKKFDWESLYAFFSCACGHIHYTTPCGYQFCFCDKIIQGEFRLNVKITMLDMFEFEKPNHSLYDSPNFWLEFEEFVKEKNETNRI